MKHFYLIIFYISFFLFASNKSILASGIDQLCFIENKGQITSIDDTPGADILFKLRANDVDVFITKNSLHYVFYKYDESKITLSSKEQEKVCTTYRVDLFMRGSNHNPTVKADEEREYYENHYNVSGYPEGILGVRSFNKITIENLYPGIDWVLYLKEGKLKYDMVIHAGANYKLIKMQYQGVKELNIEPDGSLKVHNPFGNIAEEKPLTYRAKNFTEVPSRYVLGDDNTVMFELNGSYEDKIVIDPGLSWATYYGGTNNDEGWAICTDTAGNVYTAGVTYSTSGISYGGHQNSYSGGMGLDAFLVKFNRDGSRQWATYYGGSDEDRGWAVAADLFGNVYLAGRTKSTAGISSNGYQNTYGSGYISAFLVKFNSSGIRQWGTYYGDNGATYGNSIITNGNGDVFLAGNTNAKTSISNNGYQNTYGGGSNDAFLVKFDSSGSRQWATYYGGTDGDGATSVDLDANENIYLAGDTYSTNGISNNGHQNSIGANARSDGFLVKFNSNGSRLWATYYGGSENEFGTYVSTSNNSVYLSGSTNSSDNISSSNSYQNTISGDNDVFIVKFNSNGIRQWGTYYGGNSYEKLGRATSDKKGNVFVCGLTSSETSISHNGFQNNYGLNGDAFLVKFNSNGTLNWATYYGGNKYDQATALSIGEDSKIYVTGFTNSTSGISLNGYQNSYSGGRDYDAFLAGFYYERLIINSILQSGFCGGDSVQIIYNKTIKANYGNVYAFQMSDSAGNFNNYYTLFAKTDSVKGIDTAKFVFPLIPNSASSTYRIRVVTTNPVDTIYFVDSLMHYSKPIASFVVNLDSQCFNNNNYIFQNTSTNLTGGDSYLWDFGDTTGDSTFSPSKKYVAQGYYWVKLKITSPNNCQDSTSKIVYVMPIPNVSINVLANNLCSGDTAILEANDKQGNYKYFWIADGSHNTGDTLELYKTVRSSTITLVQKNEQNCFDTSTLVNVSFKALPVKPIITRVNLILDAGSGYSTYQWYKDGLELNGEDSQTLWVVTNDKYYCRVTNVDSCENWSDTIDIIDLSVNKGLKREIIEIYPNPATGKFTVACKECSVENVLLLYDNIGRLVYQQKMDEKTLELDFTDFPRGIYFVYIQFEKYAYSNKVVIE